MPAEKLQWLTWEQEKIAYMATKGSTDAPGLVFLPGFLSDMTGAKASTMAAYAAQNNRAALRFDYSGHGQSSGDMRDKTVSHWRKETREVLTRLTQGQQILIGSSFGGWLALMMAQDMPDRIAALVLIAPAADMTDRLMWQKFSTAQKNELQKNGITYLPSEYDETGYPITKALIEDGQQHLMLANGINYEGPVRILHGVQDEAVPWALSLDISDALTSTNVNVHLIKSGDHSLSDPPHLALLTKTLDLLYDGF